MSVQDVDSSVGTPLSPHARIGELLIHRGLVTAQELEVALDRQRKTGDRIGETLVHLGFISSRDLAEVIALRLGIPFLDLAEVQLDAMLAQRIPEDIARKYVAIPIRMEDAGMIIAIEDPSDVFKIDDLRLIVGERVSIGIADPAQIHHLLDQVWTGSTMSGSITEAVAEADEDEEIVPAIVGEAEAPIIRLVDAILTRAADSRASDIHIEPGTDRIKFRFRVDGVLTDANDASLSVLRPLVSRLKIMAGLDITKTRVPQDGRFTITVRDRRIDCRMTTLPTSAGEAVVLRLLDASHGVLELAQLGFSDEELQTFEDAFRSPQGAIVASGPTGSGKTTTLYASIRELNTVDRSIVAVEDPIEYRVDGVKQIQVATRSGLTFATALRSILRADPDVILVGEIRDSETARIAMDAALTGHLVLSTIHSMGAAEVALRLIDMGAEPYVVASSLTCSVGQRLVRLLCSECSVPSQPDRNVRELLGIPDELVDQGLIRRAEGCPRCGHTGYLGRTAVHEVLRCTEDISRLIAAGGAASEIQRWAISEGMATMRSNALLRVGAGELSIDEFFRVFA